MDFRQSLWTMRRSLGAFANRYADRERIVFPDAEPAVRWTASEFDRELNRLAHGYRTIGLEPGDRLALVGVNTPAFFAAWYGAVKVGVAPCNFNPRESTDRLATLGERYGPDALVYDPRHAAQAEPLTANASPDRRVALPGAGEETGEDDRHTAENDTSFDPTHTYEAVRAAGEDAADDVDAPPDVDVRRDDTAFVNWSTGTTGVPKGLVWTNEGAVAAGAINAMARQVSHQDVRVIYGTPGFIGWFYGTFPLIVGGSKLVVMESFDPERYLELLEREGATDFGGVSTPVRLALEAGPEDYDLSSVRTAYYVGETMKRETIERIQEAITPNLRALYGTTEATGLTGVGSGSDDPTALSDHLPLVEARAVELLEGDEKATPDAQVPDGERGELILRTPGRAERVLDDPELTAHIFRDGWWYSGDVVERRPDGTYRVVGRADDMIITGGINVFPSLVEDVLAEHPAVGSVAVLGLPDDRWGQRVVAAVKLEPDTSATVDDLEDHCLAASALPRHARPREYYRFDPVEPFPTTPTGKIYRAELADELESREGDRPTAQSS